MEVVGLGPYDLWLTPTWFFVIVFTLISPDIVISEICLLSYPNGACYRLAAVADKAWTREPNKMKKGG
jgi:hypothetical protein